MSEESGYLPHESAEQQRQGLMGGGSPPSDEGGVESTDTAPSALPITADFAHPLPAIAQMPSESYSPPTFQTPGATGQLPMGNGPLLFQAPPPLMVGGEQMQVQHGTMEEMGAAANAEEDTSGYVLY